jgi:hypothetical protein
MKNKDHIPFEEREKQHSEIMKRIHENYPMAGNLSGEDLLWRPLTANVTRDLNPLTQKRMQEIAFYLFDTNPMAHRIIEIIRDFVVGDGFTIKAEDEDVQEVLNAFWNDPDNNMPISILENVTELSQFGENCFPVWVNPISGLVKLQYLDPARIVKVLKSKKNSRINDTIVWHMPRGHKDRTFKIHIPIIHKYTTFKIIPANNMTGKLEGDAFFFTINKPISASRGRSDLLSLADWLDGYDQFLFARLERAFLLNTFIWDITADGMDKKELDAFVRELGIPKPGSIRAHNDKIKWDAVSPKLEGHDASNEAALYKAQILGGAGYPGHWFSEGERTTRATAKEMSLPTLKKLKSRQKLITFQYTHMLDFQIEMAIEKGTLKKDVNRKFKLIPSPIVSNDSKGLAQTISSFVDGLEKAVSNNWLSNEEAKNATRNVLRQVGVESFDDDTDPINNEEEPNEE